jgi:syntaxin-binding protein 5
LQFEPNRIIITQHADLTVRFLDVSVQLLIPTSSSPYTSAFPRQLPALTIDVPSLLSSPLLAKGFDFNVSETHVQTIFLSVEALETAIALTGGEVILYRLRSEVTVDLAPKVLQDDQLVSLEHIAVDPTLRFKPYFMIKPKGPVTTLTMTDIGEWSRQ